MSLSFIVEIPTKPYIKAWMERDAGKYNAKHGRVVAITKDSSYGKYFFELVGEPTRERDKRINLKNYKARVCIEISYSLFLRCGTFLTPTNIVRFNNCVEDLIKEQLSTFYGALTMDIPGRKPLKAAKVVNLYMEKYGFDETSFPSSTIKKYLQRAAKESDTLQNAENQ